VKVKDFSKYLQRLEQTSKRLEITSILVELIEKLDVDEIDKAMYLAQGYLAAPFAGLKFNIADKMMFRIIEAALSTPSKLVTVAQITEEYKKTGDLGNTIFNLQETEKGGDIEVSELHEALVDISNTEGGGSQEAKVSKTAVLLRLLDRVSAKYLTRIILGTTRLGFTELTVIAALAQFCGDKSKAKEIEACYNVHPDIGLIAKKVKTHGIKGLKDIRIEVGVPVLSQKAQRVSGLEEAIERIPLLWAEYKFDGTRVQLHLDRNKEPKKNNQFEQSSFFAALGPTFLMKTFTRNLEETTHQYPDIISAADKQIDADSVILDGEAIGFNKETGEFLPFQETIQRKRKHGVAEAAINIPLKYYVFDILYYNGNPTTDLTLVERHALLEKIIKHGDVVKVAEKFTTDTLEGLEEFFQIAKEKKLEGLIAKKSEDPYQAGARSYSWIKLKLADDKLLKDSVDCVVLGYYVGKGGRSKFGIGGFLVGIYDEKSDNFKTITKIGTGLDEDDWTKLKNLADKLKVEKVPANVQMDKMFTPDVILKPSLVVEVGADEISKSPSHTAGYALRFPRLLKFREDKRATESTTLDEIEKMYENQRK
jgi:DNA ligase-1